MREMTSEDKLKLIETVAKHESGGRFHAMNRDGEFKGAFGEDHPAFNTFHVGLSYGIIQFTQDGGSLGRLLERMRDRDSGAFERIFGPAADELIAVTTASGPRSKDSPPRSARVQPVAGADLWEDEWTDRFREAGRHRPFQLTQLELASEAFLDPMLTFCKWVGLDTDRALAMVFDRAVQFGRGGARRWVTNNVGPVTDDEVIEHALDVWSFDSLKEFQESVPGLDADGSFGPNTHAAMMWFERQRGDDEAFAFFCPSREEMYDLLVQAGEGTHWGHRLGRIRDAPDFTDEEFDL